MIVKYRLFSALTTILRNHPGVNHKKTVKAADHLTQSIKLSIDYIQRNFEHKLTLEEIARELQREYGKQIVIVDGHLAKTRHFASFVNDETLEDVLNALCTHSGMKVQEKDSVIYIRNN